LGRGLVQVPGALPHISVCIKMLGLGCNGIPTSPILRSPDVLQGQRHFTDSALNWTPPSANAMLAVPSPLRRQVPKVMASSMSPSCSPNVLCLESPRRRASKLSATSSWQTPTTQKKGESEISTSIFTPQRSSVTPTTQKKGVSEASTNIFTPQRSSVCSFTPPSAPNFDRQADDIEEDIKFAISSNSIPLLSYALNQHPGCGCGKGHLVHAAVSHGSIDALELLLECGMVESGNEYCRNETAVHRAARITHAKGDLGYRILDLLLANGAQVDTDFKTPLQEAAQQGRVEATKLLLKYGAKVDAVDERSNTPLHLACSLHFGSSVNQQARIVRFLAAHGADPSLRNADGKTAVHLLPQTAAGSPLHTAMAQVQNWWGQREAKLAFASGHNCNDICTMPKEVLDAVGKFL